MADLFFDSSGLIKYYQTETGSDKVTALVDDTNNVCRVSVLAIVEIQSALARRVRMGHITAAEFSTVRSQFYTHLRARKFHVVPLASRHFRQAVRLLVKHGLTARLRTLDALQLAVALDFRQQGHFDHFVCADAGLCAVAQAEGLAVINPEVP